MLFRSVNALGVNTINNGGRAAWLINQYWPQVNTQADGAALQLAIWDVVHDNGDGFSTGRVQQSLNGTSYEAVFAEARLFELDSVGRSASNALVYTDSNGATAHQRLMTTAASPTPTSLGAVPEPATFMLMGSGLLAGFLWLRRTKKV